MAANPPLLATLRGSQASFSASERKIARHVLAAPERVIHQSITEVQQASGAGYGSVVRFCQRLGAAGFHDFKIRLAQEIAARAPEVLAADEDALVERVCADLRRTAAEAAKPVARAAELLAGAGRVLVIGCGGSSATALSVDYVLRRLGVFAAVATDAHMMAIGAAGLGRGDALVACSHSGATKDVLAAVSAARERGARVIALTGAPASPLGGDADVALPAVVRADAFSAELATRTSAELVIDLLARAIAANGKDARRHLQRTYEAVAGRQV
jgi:DNA-binding MurR/RpiR family transcriptional regulator